MTVAAPTLLLDLYATNNRAGQLVEAAITEAEITADEYALLSYLGNRSPTTPTEMSRDLGLSLTTTLFRVGNLERSGYVRRKPNPDDGRSFLLSLTKRGRAKLLEARAGFRISFAALSKRLRDPVAIQASLRLLAEAIDAELADAAAGHHRPRKIRS